MGFSARRRPIWLGFAELRPTLRGTYRLHLRWGRIAGTLAVLTAAGYLSVAAGIYLLYKERRNFTEITYVDILLWRRESLRQRQGEADIARGLEALERGRHREAFHFLRTGVDRAPAHLHGRLLLIQMYARGYPEHARILLERGLQYHADNLEFNVSYARFLLLRREDAALLGHVRAVLDRETSSRKLRQTMALYGMQVSSRRGQFAEAAHYFRAHGLADTPEGVLEAAEMLARSGRHKEAVAFIRGTLSRPEMLGHVPLHARLVGLQLDTKDFRGAVESALDLALLAPLDWQPRMLLLNAYEKSGRTDDIQRETAAFLMQFRDDPAATMALAQFAQRTGDVSVARQANEAALENGFDIARFGLIFIETHLSAGLYSEALALCRQLEGERPPWLDDHLTEFNSLRSIAHHALGDAQRGGLYQREFLRHAHQHPRLLHSVARAFQRSNQPHVALSVLEEAWAADPADEQILSELIDLQLELGESRNLAERVEALLALRRPGYAIFSRMRAELERDHFLDLPQREELAEAIDAVLAEAVEGSFDFGSTATSI